MRVINFFGCFVTGFRVVPRSPLIHRYEVNELDGECRTSIAVFIRLWPIRWVIGFGRWHPTGLSESEMFRKVFESEELSIDDPQVAAAVRQRIADLNGDIDDEWTILQELGLDE